MDYSPKPALLSDVIAVGVVQSATQTQLFVLFTHTRGGKDGFVRFWFFMVFKKPKTSKGRNLYIFMVFLDIVFLYKLCA